MIDRTRCRWTGPLRTLQVSSQPSFSRGDCGCRAACAARAARAAAGRYVVEVSRVRERHKRARLPARARARRRPVPAPQKSNADRLRTFFSRGAALGRSDYAFKAEENRTRIHATDIGMSPSKNVCEFVLVVASGLGRSEYCSARAAVRREVVQL